MREVRDYQAEAVIDIRAEWGKGNTRTAIVHATGLGKTDIIAKLATDEATAGGRVLLLAHRSEPLDQMTARCDMYAPQIEVGRVQAEDNEIDCPIIAASMQTLAHDRRRAQLDVLKPFTLVIVDECHHVLSPSYITILRWAGCFEGVRTLGVTATLIRGDHRGFGQVFQSVADERDTRWAIDHGWLVVPRGYAVVADDLKTDRLTVRHGDYVDGELGPVIEQSTEAIVKAWMNNAGNRITVAFTPTIAAATALREEFTTQGVPAEVVIGSTDRKDRKAIYARLAAGETRVLVGVGVMTEAWDCPPVSCVLMARPTKLPGLYQQMVGRGLRLSEGKTDCLVLDVTSVDRHEIVSLKDMLPGALYDSREVTATKARKMAEAIESAQRAQRKQSVWGKIRGLFSRTSPRNYQSTKDRR